MFLLIIKTIVFMKKYILNMYEDINDTDVCKSYLLAVTEMLPIKV